MTRSYAPAAPPPAAALLQLARIKRGWSQRQLADQACVPVTMISAYERGKRQPTIATLVRLLRAAGFDLQLHLIEADHHDDVLARLESQRSPQELARLDRQMSAWRKAKLVS